MHRYVAAASLRQCLKSRHQDKFDRNEMIASSTNRHRTFFGSV